MDRIEILKKRIKMCNIITVTALFLIVVCIVAEFLIAQFMKDKAAAVDIVNGIAYFCYVLPFAVMIPLFFRVNFKSKLIMEMKKKEG